MKRNGFTLLEIMIVFAIIALITVVAFTNLFGWKSQTDLQNVTKQVGALLREAQSNSMTQENGTAWGVHFDNSTSTTPYYALFASSTYSKSSVIGSYPLPSSVAYLTSTLPLGSTKDIIFDQVSGDASASTSIGFYLLSDPSQSSTINVSAAGAISYLNPAHTTYGGSYLHYRTITIDHARVANTDQTNFPMVFSGTYSYLATVANGGDVSNGNGYDIVFTSDAAGQNMLDFEQESYDPKTGKVAYWIRIPTLSHSSDTVIYMFYGNPNITTSQANPTGVWGGSYAGVYHFPNGTNLSANDSTANGDNGVISGVSATTGEIDGGAKFPGSGYINLPNLSNYAAGDFTVSTWINFSSLPAYNAIMVGKSQATNVLFISTQSSGEGLRMGTTNDAEDAAASYTWSTNTWYYVALVRRSGVSAFYVNGVALPTTNEAQTTFDYVDTNQNIGGDGGSYPLSGSLDEFRFSTVARSADWIKTEYNNQSSPSTFYTLGNTDAPIPPPQVASDFAYFRTITIDHTKVANTDQTNFPVLFSGTYPYLATLANGGNVENVNGDDIIFTSDASGTQMLDFEQESYDSTTGQVAYWIRIPNLSHTQDTVIYMFYGDSNITKSEANPTGVWDSNYVSVWHLPNGTTLSAQDSTVNSYDGTISAATAVTGTFDGGVGFNGSNNYLQSANLSVIDSNTQPFTVTVWFKANAAGDILTETGQKAINTGWHDSWMEVLSSGSVVTRVWQCSAVTAGSASFSTWNQVVLVYNGSTIYSYLNGVPGASTGCGRSSPGASGDQEYLNLGATDGQNMGSGAWFNGSMDEFRVSNVARSADWIKTEYNNEASPSTFYSVGATDAPPVPPQVGSDFAYMRTVTVNHTMVSSTDQTNFPMLFSGTYSYLATTANGGDIQTSNGTDIIFTSDSAGNNLLNFEQESYNPVTGAANYWIQVPTLSHTTDTVIYMFYGDANATKSQANPAGVWDSNYAGVWHFPDGTTLSANDSTANGNNGTINNATAASGQIDGAGSYNGSNTTIEIANSTSLNQTAVTLSAWVYLKSYGGSGTNYIRGIIGKYNSAGGNEYFLRIGADGTSGGEGYPTLGGGTQIDQASNFPLNSWHYLVGTADGGGNAVLYLDGSPVANGTVSISTGNDNVYIGQDYLPNARIWDGYIDEARISKIARSGGWIATEYANESSPSTFYTVGTQNAP